VSELPEIPDRASLGPVLVLGIGSSRTIDVLRTLSPLRNVSWLASLSAMPSGWNLEDFACVVVADDLTEDSNLELVAKIRAISPDLPICLVTEADDLADAVAGMRLGATRVVEIPPSYDLLRRYVANAASRQA
jgi:DNA-binding NtrC family response regulator